MAIVEMGASHPGDIRELVEIAEPNFGLITNVGKAHLQGFGSFEGVQRTKAELYDYLIAHRGIIFLNEDNEYLVKMLGQHEAIKYHRMPMPEGTHLIGVYNAENIAAALAVGRHFGVSEEEGLAAIRAYVPTNNRSQLVRTERNTVVVDAYNANPTSMTAAIEAFYQTYGEGTFILGAMRELGDYSQVEHQNIVNMLLERKATQVFLVGDEYRNTTAPYPIFASIDELNDYVRLHPISEQRILLKGSRSNQMEKILPLL